MGFVSELLDGHIDLGRVVFLERGDLPPHGANPACHDHATFSRHLLVISSMACTSGRLRAGVDCSPLERPFLQELAVYP